jgi:hypothetical protein
LPDGRQLWFEVGGDPHGYPVIGLHGTPGCQLNVPTAAVVVSEGGGHLPADPVAEIAGNMAWLRHGVVPAC